MARHKKVEWKYEAIYEETMTEEEANGIAQILAEMIYEYHYGTRKGEQHSSKNKEDE